MGQEAESARLELRIKQLERDYEYLMASLVALNTRFANLDERERRRELAVSRGVR